MVALARGGHGEITLSSDTDRRLSTRSLPGDQTCAMEKTCRSGDIDRWIPASLKPTRISKARPDSGAQLEQM
jgi:hypothetical protein